jgi:hypothetical protein
MNLETDSTEADSARSLDVFYRLSDARLVLDVFRVRRQQLEMDRIEHVASFRPAAICLSACTAFFQDVTICECGTRRATANVT